MCGIAGYIRLENTSIETCEVIRRMVKQLQHRGPYSHDVFIKDKVGFGHTRLPIIDLSSAGNQPFTDASGRYIMVFNGTIYNYKELRKELTSYPFSTQTDTEVLMAAFVQWGADCVKKLDGIFSFTIWDKLKNKLFLARDSFGVKPLYYILTDRFLVFASEVRALLESGLSTRKINKNAIYHYLVHQSVPCEENLVADIKELRPGSYGFFENGSLSTTHYYNIFNNTFTDNEDISVHSYENKIRELFSAAVKKRMVGDVPIGVFLSGGIDSSVLVAAMSEIPGANINTFTVFNRQQSSGEHLAAATIAKKFKANHLEIVLEEDTVIDLIEKALAVMDSPSGDGINTFLISNVAHKAGFRLALSGIGGDELFMGYPFFRVMSTIKKYETFWNKTSAIRNGFSRLPIFEGNLMSRKIKNLLQLKTASLPELYPVFRNVWDPTRLEKLLGTAALLTPKYSDKLDNNTGDFKRYPFISQITIAEYLGYSQHTLLKDTDQMGMAVSLEIREPYFDRDLVSFVLSIPDKFKYSGLPKDLLLKSFSHILPQSLIHKRKVGFTFPWEKWMRNELKDFCEGNISRFAQRGLVNKDYILNCWSDFVNGGNRFNFMEIWVLVVLEYWLEKNGVE